MSLTQQQFNSICTKIETTTLGVRSILLTYYKGIRPEQFYRILRNNEKNREKYARAKELQADIIAEEINDIADDGSNDFMEIVKGDKVYVNENKEFANRSRLRVETRKWLLSKLLPRKYGEKLDVTSGGDKLPVPPAAITVTIAKDRKK